jgi:antirestriction protein ArdC
MSNQEVYEAITRRMIKALEAGTIPWQKPWTAAAGGPPMRMSNGEPYRGVNTLLLGWEAQERGYSSPWWGTYDEIARRSGMEQRTNSRGGSFWVSPDGSPRGVRKGEKGTKIVFSKTVIKKETDPVTGERTERPVYLMHMWSVFNADQAEQLPAKYYPAREGGEPVAEIRDAQEVLDKYLANGGPTLRHVAGDRAHYQAGPDRITLPEREQFTSREAYYGAAFHEAGHSTGHPSRLDREGIAHFDHFGTERYAKEELVAQITSAMLQAETGIETPEEWDRSAAYVRNWLGALREDPKLVPQAAAAAQRAVDLISEPQRQAERDDQPEAETEREAA